MIVSWYFDSDVFVFDVVVCVENGILIRGRCAKISLHGPFIVYGQSMRKEIIYIEVAVDLYFCCTWYHLITCCTIRFNIRENYNIGITHQVTDFLFLFLLLLFSIIVFVNWPLNIYIYIYNYICPYFDAWRGFQYLNQIISHSKYCFLNIYEIWLTIFIEHFQILRKDYYPPPPSLPVVWYWKTHNYSLHIVHRWYHHTTFPFTLWLGTHIHFCSSAKSRQKTLQSFQSQCRFCEDN